MEFQEDSDFNNVIDNLVSMFGHIVTKEVISTVVESCEGDLNLSMDAIMNLANDGNVISVMDDAPPVENDIQPSTSQQSGSSYANPSPYAHNRGAIPKQAQVKRLPAPIFWTDQFRQIISHHNKANRLMIVMRGLPGSGKSYLAASLVESMVGENFKSHIFSTDDYFMNRGKYMYDLSKLSLAHCWNQERVRNACVHGLSPIVVDNTNVEVWEMQPYVVDGVKNGYIIEVVEMNTPWAKKANQLFKRNKHGVPYHIIKRKLENYTEGVTGEGVVRSFGLSYPANLVPPIRRLLPPVNDAHISMQTSELTKVAKSVMNNNNSSIQSSQSCVTVKENIEVLETSVIIRPDQSNEEDGTKNLEEQLPSTQELNQPVSSFQEISQPVATLQEISQSDSIFQDISQAVSSCHTVSQSVFSFQEVSQSAATCHEIDHPVSSTQEISQSLSNNESDFLTQEDQVKQRIVLEAQKQLEEIQKFEEEWENGEKWDDNDQATASTSGLLKSSTAATSSNTMNSATIISSTLAAKNITSPSSYITNLESKPPRKSNNLQTNVESKDFMQTANDSQDWRFLFVPPWVTPGEEPQIISKEDIPIETINSSTCVEIGDTDVSGKHKVIAAISRNINEFYVAPEREKIPQKRMLDKSSMTNEGILMSFHCPQKERHFILFRKLFMHIERDSLRDIFDNCCGDPNWAVESILGGGVKYTLKSNVDEEDSDLEDDSEACNGLTCTCLAKYNIIPDIYKYDALPSLPQLEKAQATATRVIPHTEKKKRDVSSSDENIQLKRQIEQNIVISDNHYSDHCLKIRKIRRGEYNTDGNVLNSEQPSTSGICGSAAGYDVSNTIEPIDESSDDDDNDSCASDVINEKIVNVNMGKTFIKQLDEIFDRKDMEYPDNIAFNISLPSSLLNELNALWMESIMFQLDELSRKSTEMIKQDEEFARQIALKEEELKLEGKEPSVPDLKEIMDLEFAISIHKKEMSEWRNKIPTDLAAKMTHEKLFNLFPDIEKELLLEMLIAHDNNFKATVEVVLMSMGRNDVLESKNGVNKFVMDKELERQEKLLEEHRKALMESEWPPVSQGEDVDMDTVKGYRNEAMEHLNSRNMSKLKAEEYIRRGMPKVATYYFDIANFHKIREEQANSMAVASLIQFHSKNNSSCDTVDLHYFRVKEAKESMDIFIDTHIHKLRELNKHDVVLFFITGRGLHSPGRPRVKPACAHRLRQRGLRYSECNPGLLRARVSCNNKLTYQVP